MAKYFMMYQCRPGSEAEYVERHKHVWPEVIQALKAAGFRNFTTFMKGNQLYATIENDGDFKKAWAQFQADPHTVRWEKFMSEVLITDVTQGDMDVTDNVVFHME